MHLTPFLLIIRIFLLPVLCILNNWVQNCTEILLECLFFQVHDKSGVQLFDIDLSCLYLFFLVLRSRLILRTSYRLFFSNCFSDLYAGLTSMYVSSMCCVTPIFWNQFSHSLGSTFSSLLRSATANDL